jgi:hypothetical protein
MCGFWESCECLSDRVLVNLARDVQLIKQHVGFYAVTESRIGSSGEEGHTVTNEPSIASLTKTEISSSLT